MIKDITNRIVKKMEHDAWLSFFTGILDPVKAAKRYQEICDEVNKECRRMYANYDRPRIQ